MVRQALPHPTPMPLPTGAPRASARLAPRCTVALACALVLLAPRVGRAQEASLTPAPRQRAAPLAALGASAAALRDSLVALARAQVGRRYRLGGDSPARGFDCSGLIQYISRALSIRLPRTAAQQARAGAAVPRDTTRLLPGDLVTFGRGRISHIGIYVGSNRFVHASSGAGRVIESPLVRPLYPGVKPWRGARRLVGSDTLSAGAPTG